MKGGCKLPPYLGHSPVRIPVSHLRRRVSLETLAASVFFEGEEEGGLAPDNAHQPESSALQLQRGLADVVTDTCHCRGTKTVCVGSCHRSCMQREGQALRASPGPHASLPFDALRVLCGPLQVVAALAKDSMGIPCLA